MYLLQKAMAVVFGSLLVGAGVNGFLVPHQLMDGGMIGIGLLAKYYLSWQPGLVMLAVSVPIYAVVFWQDRRLFYHSFHGMVLSSFLIDALHPLRAYNPFPPPVSAVVGGSLIGAGIGMMLAHDTNTGGTDLIAQFLAKRLEVSVALLIFVIDGLIVLLSVQAIGLLRMAYSLLTITFVAVFTHHFAKRGGRRRTPYEVIGPVSLYFRQK